MVDAGATAARRFQHQRASCARVGRTGAGLPKKPPLGLLPNVPPPPPPNVPPPPPPPPNVGFAVGAPAPNVGVATAGPPPNDGAPKEGELPLFAALNCAKPPPACAPDASASAGASVSATGDSIEAQVLSGDGCNAHLPEVLWQAIQSAQTTTVGQTHQSASCLPQMTTAVQKPAHASVRRGDAVTEVVATKTSHAHTA